MTKMTLLGDADDADLIWPSPDDVLNMDLQAGKVKISEITVYYSTSVSAIKIKLSNGVQSPVLSNSSASELALQKTTTLKLDQTKTIDTAQLFYSPVYSTIGGFILSDKK